jgi:methylmalonyl-CoA/ethylmalonyl-CoA epimerase
MSSDPRAELGDLLGDVTQVCLVTRDLEATMDRLSLLGLGPWRVQTFAPHNVDDPVLRGAPHSYACRMAFAPASNFMWEIVQPLEGTGVFQDFLDRHGEGIHHLGFAAPHGYPRTLAELEARGFQLVQSGRVWDGHTGYAFLAATEGEDFYLEIWDHTPGSTPPPPESWYPAPPADTA